MPSVLKNQMKPSFVEFCAAIDEVSATQHRLDRAIVDRAIGDGVTDELAIEGLRESVRLALIKVKRMYIALTCEELGKQSNEKVTPT